MKNLKIYLILLVNMLKSFAFMNSQNPKVVVIGAGISGLTCAYRLYQQGVDVSVYEAKNRVGGRIFSVIVDDKIAELGAQNITDGGDAKNLLSLVNELGLEIVETKNAIVLNRHYVENKNLISSHTLLNQRNFTKEWLEEKFSDAIPKSKNIAELLSQVLPPSDPLYKMTATSIAAYEGGVIENLSIKYSETLYHMLLGGICSAHQNNDENSYLHVGIKNGNAFLPQTLANKLGEIVKINMPLIAVSINKDKYFLRFENGEQAEADILVLSMPAGTYSDIIFDRGIIPDFKLEQIKTINMGTNAKILIPFDKPVKQRIQFVTDEIVTFFNATSDVLGFYYTKDSGKFDKDGIAKAFSKNSYLLNLVFEDRSFSMFNPTFAQDQQFAKYSGVVGYSWPNDKFIKGSYHYISPGQENLLTDLCDYKGEKFKTLFTPIEDKLFFAGEHTSILFDVPGTMEAACESGERVARAILKNLV